jgi:phospholipid transport system substrate-binding protein
MKKTIFLILLFALLLPSAGWAGEPTEELKKSVDAVIDVLKDKELMKPENTKQRRDKIRNIVNGRFDYEEMAKRSLALHWRNRTPEEKKEFVPLYSDLLERTYIDKIEKYRDEKVLYVGELTEGQNALVKTKVITAQDVEIPISYRLSKEADGWKVYDVIIEGVSLVQNYRSQFNSIIRSDSYQVLVKKLRDKVGEQGQ